MKILFDISHPAHLNFFKNSIKLIQAQGHIIYMTVLDRGRLLSIVRKEFQDIQIYKTGRHRGGALSIIFEANILKFFEFLKVYIKIRPDVAFSCGGFVIGSIMKLFGRPNYQFDDDPERKVNVFLEKITSKNLFFPPIISEKANIKVFNGVKEWAYLSPAYFKPDRSVLDNFKINPYEYIFVREISRKTLNYIDQDKKSTIKAIIEATSGHKVLLSLEKKEDRPLYPNNWILLEEPVTDIHSLIYFSKMLISSGDSMAREACLLGVPAFYCGGRKMAVNDFLKNNGLFFESLPYDLPLKVKEVKEVYVGHQESVRQKMYTDWDDLTKMVIDLSMVNV